jgi:hypothetical protein
VSRVQQVGCRRAAALARGMARDLEQLVGDGAPRAADSLRTAVRGIDYALGVGLGFELASDPEVTYRRGHARNLALVLRRTVEASLSAGTDPARSADLLSQAARMADELSQTVSWIWQRGLQLEAPTPVEPWTTGWAGRLLALAARQLPPEQRGGFVEDQCGNLASIDSRREWLGYLLGLLTRMPRIAAAAAPGRSRW